MLKRQARMFSSHKTPWRRKTSLNTALPNYSWSTLPARALCSSQMGRQLSMSLPSSFIMTIYVPKQVVLTSGNHRIPKNPRTLANIMLCQDLGFTLYSIFLLSATTGSTTSTVWKVKGLNHTWLTVCLLLILCNESLVVSME